MSGITIRAALTDDERALVECWKHEATVLSALQSQKLATFAAVDATATVRCDRKRMEKAHRRAIREAMVRVACLEARINDELRPLDA